VPEPDVIQYRPPRARIAIAYSTKDRVEQTRATIPRLLDDPRFDLYWFDGSSTEAGQQLPLQLCPGRAAICALHRGVTGGPDSAIIYALQLLRGLRYDLVILIENDVVLADGWLEALHESMDQAKSAGFKVGGATVRVYAQRVLSFNHAYCLMLNSGGGFVALTAAAIDIVLANYRTLDGAEFIRHFHSVTGIDVSGTIEFEATRRLSADWLFDLILYLHGYVVSAPPSTFATTIDDDQHPSVMLVTHPEQHLPSVRMRLSQPHQIRDIAYKCFRFQKSPLSDRVLIGCHQLQVDVNTTDSSLPVRAQGAWRRVWLQGLGPFGLQGAGEISVTTHGATVGLLLCAGSARVELNLSTAGTTTAFALEPNTLIDLPLEADAPADPLPRCSVLRSTSGQICMVGLTSSAALLSEYATAQPTLDHLRL